LINLQPTDAERHPPKTAASRYIYEKPQDFDFLFVISECGQRLKFEEGELSIKPESQLTAVLLKLKVTEPCCHHKI